MIPKAEPLVRANLVSLPVDGDRPGDPAALVVTDHVDIDAPGLSIADKVAFLEEGGCHRGHRQVERDGLHVVRFESKPDLLQAGR